MTTDDAVFPPDVARELPPMPVLLTCGELDPQVPCHMTDQLASVVGHRVVLPAVGHAMVTADGTLSLGTTVAVEHRAGAIARPPMVNRMTLSIVAHSRAEKSWGVAVASRYLAVGAMVPAAEFGVGALATQARTNMAYREDGLSLLRAGLGATEVVEALVGDDDRSGERQVGVVDRDGMAAAWTGAQCGAFAGARLGEGYAVLGNLLAGEEVLEAMESAWLGADSATSLADQLLAALAAGDEAGGDRRGRQSAAVFVVGLNGIGHGTHVEVDLRVDDAPAPISELIRLRQLHRQLHDMS